MAKHTTGTRKEWLAARLELLQAEKDLTRRSDEVARQQQELPWVQIDKQYRFDTDEGNASLADLFRGRSQLLIYHFMFGPEYSAGCRSCSAIADGFNGFVVHLANHDVMLWAVSRAPLEKLQAYRRRMGWQFPWASSFGGDFNTDFHVYFTEQQQREGGIEYNYHREPPVRSTDKTEMQSRASWWRRMRSAAICRACARSSTATPSRACAPKPCRRSASSAAMLPAARCVRSTRAAPIGRSRMPPCKAC